MIKQQRVGFVSVESEQMAMQGVIPLQRSAETRDLSQDAGTCRRTPGPVAGRRDLSQDAGSAQTSGTTGLHLQCSWLERCLRKCFKV